MPYENARPIKRCQLLLLTVPLLILLAFPTTAIAQDDINIEKQVGKVSVLVGDELFAAYNFRDTNKPFLYPVLGPNQTRMTRDFPMKETAGEADDHPHHKSIWIGHEINDIDFWTCRGGASIVVGGEPSIDASKNRITANSRWIDAEKQTICTDKTIWTFGFDDDSRWIDCEFCLIASEASLKINDTKEGTVAIRTHPDLRLKADADRGVNAVFGKATNSKGTSGAKVWGEAASWVAYSGTIDSTPASILILDHPSNFRHPTTWHARDYGLVAANPFGLAAFQKLGAGAGQVALAKGQQLKLRYRFQFFAAEISAEQCDQAFDRFAQTVLTSAEDSDAAKN
jgi:hypothetical protein